MYSKGKVVRIPHGMKNANKEDLAQTEALQKVLEARGTSSHAI